MRILIVCTFLASATSAYAQLGVWGKVDTVTSGNFDDMDPQLDDGGLYSLDYFAPFEWLVFERWYNGPDSICAMKIEPSATNGAQVQFDSAVVISTTINYLRERPDIATVFSPNGPTTLAAWEENDSRLGIDIQEWSIYYAYTSGSETKWSIPQVISGEADDPTIQNAIVRPLSDSSFVLIWRQSGTLMFSTFSNNQISSPDTLVETNYDSTEFDFAFVAFPNPTVVWTGRDSSGNVDCYLANVTDFSPVELSHVDTITSQGDISDPKFLDSYGRAFTINVNKGGRFKTVLESYSGYSNTWCQQDIASDSSSDNMNAVGLSFLTAIPVGASPAQAENSEPSSVTPGFFAWERRSGSDTSLIFTPMTDTVRSTGYNENPSMTTYTLTESSGILFPCVWVSNRTGRSHIYARVGSYPIMAVSEPPQSPRRFVLEQNYPDPFNPSTEISYSIPTNGFVTLKIYNVLGQEVATLFSGMRSPGEYTATFNAGGFASGVYFYRLQAGSFSVTKKMLLLK